ncbi:type II secretion system inner membrane protein GspF [Salinicola aestuarinus]|uniref:type II secretion system inner membrane protein GspF n=1 Tax=Salinicola aestuarinus TaxID=1949082 RepID=UPI000DA1B1BC|nr:type II secretion system inner membrane protein GspF [Salinicola aestuarinus]
MPTYRYVALTVNGARRRDVVQADSERQARQRLRDQGLFPRKLQRVEAGRQARSAHAGTRGAQMDATQLTLMTRQLATLIEAGIPIGDALQALTDQTEKPRARALLLAVLDRVREGHSLADSLRAHPTTFSTLYCALVAAGERAGRLAVVLERLADYLERVQAQRQKARTALVYPTVLIVVSVGVVIGLMTYVVPRLADQFANADMTLPWITRFMIALSEGLQSSGLWLAIVVPLVIVAINRALRRAAFRRRWDAGLLRLPRIGELVSLLDTARLTRTLAILTQSGIPLLDALRVSRDTLGNCLLRESVDHIAERVTTGVSLHKAMGEVGRFSPTMLHMVASGEASGRLENMLERIADNQETTFNRRVDMALALFEPLIILAMGGVVLAIVLSILLPIMRLNGAMAI